MEDVWIKNALKFYNEMKLDKLNFLKEGCNEFVKFHRDEKGNYCEIIFTNENKISIYCLNSKMELDVEYKQFHFDIIKSTLEIIL